MHKKEEFSKDIRASAYLFITIFFVLAAIRLEHTIVITSFAATCYIMFHLPTTVSAKHRNMIGGHLIGLFTGLLATQVRLLGFTSDIVMIAFAVGISSLIMSILELHHPPANGTALAVALCSGGIQIIISVLSSICIIYVMSTIFRKKGHNPMSNIRTNSILEND